MLAIRIADAGEKERIEAFYTSEQRRVEVHVADQFVLAENNGSLVGVVRLCREEGEYVLRTMFVNEAFRGKGLGREMLQVFKPLIEGKVCYCLPFSHLEPFYGTIGFQSIAIELAPPHLQQRLAKYIGEGLDMIAMMRSA